MRVLDILNAASPDKVEEEYLRAYSEEVKNHGTDAWANAHSFSRYRQIVNDTISVVDGGMCVVITYVREDGYGRYDVSGRQPNDEVSYALEFSPWGEWKLMNVNCPSEMDVHQAACHLYYEMTWYGWPDQIAKAYNKYCI